MSVFVTKGMRIRAKWFEARLESLSGGVPKVGAVEKVVTGVVRHVRGDHPTDPKTVRVYVESEDGLGVPCGRCQVREMEIHPEHIVEVLNSRTVVG
jgi:hypothetical protein